MKSMNCISATGRSPRNPIPQAAPTMAVSLMGVSITRSRPNFESSPSVALKAPPYTPMSSPIATTAWSRTISSNIACRIPSIIVMGAMSASPAFIAWILMGAPVARVLRFSHGFIFRPAPKRNPGDFRRFRLDSAHGRFRLRLALCFDDRLGNFRAVASGIAYGRADRRRSNFFANGFYFCKSAVIFHFPAGLKARRRRRNFCLRTLPGSLYRVATFAVNAFFGQFGRRHGRFFRELLLPIQFTLDACVDFRLRLRVPNFIFSKIFFVKRYWIASLPILKHLLGNVFSRIVLGVAPHAHRFHFD